MSIVATISKMYQKSVSKQLAKYGLRYDDCLVESESLSRAISWLPAEEQLARERRLSRAADLGFKRAYLPEEIQQMQEPMNHYLVDHLKQAEALEEEREELTRW